MMEKRRSLLERLVEAVTALGIGVSAVSGFLGLRALAWGQQNLVEQMILSGATLSAVILGAAGIFYLIFGRWMLRAVGIDWLSMRFGALIGGLLYAGYHALVPLTSAEALEEPLQRAVQGGLDGLVIGALLGLVTWFVSGRRVTFDSFGLTRYFLLYLVLLLIAGVAVLVEAFFRLPDATIFVLAIPAVLALRVAVHALDRRADALQSAQ